MWRVPSADALTKIRMAAERLRRNVNPDSTLQLGHDLLDALVERLHKKLRDGRAFYEEDREFLLAAIRESRATAFEARRLLTQQMLRRLSQGQLTELRTALENEEGESWLPPT